MAPDLNSDPSNRQVPIQGDPFPVEIVKTVVQDVSIEWKHLLVDSDGNVSSVGANLITQSGEVYPVEISTEQLRCMGFTVIGEHHGYQVVSSSDIQCDTTAPNVPPDETLDHLNANEAANTTDSSKTAPEQFQPDAPGSTTTSAMKEGSDDVFWHQTVDKVAKNQGSGDAAHDLNGYEACLNDINLELFLEIPNVGSGLENSKLDLVGMHEWVDGGQDMDQNLITDMEVSPPSLDQGNCHLNGGLEPTERMEIDVGCLSIEECDENLNGRQQQQQNSLEIEDPSAQRESRRRRDRPVKTTTTPQAPRVQCKLCAKTYKTKRSLNNHLRQMHKTDPLKCEVEGCPLTFACKKQKQRHENSGYHDYSNGKVACKICKRGIQSRNAINMRRHMKQHPNI